MSKLTILSHFSTVYTLIPNDFVDHFMLSANGEFVKIYIYLLRQEQMGKSIPDLASIADALSCTENDVQRALNYWEKQGLISLSMDEQTEIHGKEAKTAGSPASEGNLSMTDSSAAQEAAGSRNGQNLEKGPEAASANRRALNPDMMQLSNERRRNLVSSCEEAQQIRIIAERYIGKPLTGAELNRILYFYDELHFSVELIDYLIDYCVSRNKRSLHYITKVGLGWYEDGITTVTEAKDRTSTWSKEYYTILRSLGISGMNPIPRQVEFMKRWLYDYGFSLELICEACQRTVAKTGQPSFEYTEGILSSWKKQQVTSMEQVRDIDQKHQNSQQQKTCGSHEGNTGDRNNSSEARKAGTNRFNNFHQREYNYAQLEKDILQKQLSGKK